MRGCQKKVIFLKDTGSHLFDEAYFIVSRACEDACIREDDMVFEANRIIDESLGVHSPGRRGKTLERVITHLLPFLLGAFVTAIGFIAYNVI